MSCLCFFVVVFFYDVFFFFFEFDIITLSIGLWLQSLIRVEYKLSISHSNSCIWQVPVRHPNAFQLSEDPSLSAGCPTSSRHCPSTPCPHYCAMRFLSQDGCHLSARPPSCGLHQKKKKKKRESCCSCHRCVVVPETCFSNGWCSHLLPVCFVLSVVVIFDQYLVGFLEI